MKKEEEKYRKEIECTVGILIDIYA